MRFHTTFFQHLYFVKTFFQQRLKPLQQKITAAAEESLSNQQRQNPGTMTTT